MKEGWEYKKLGEFCDFISGFTPKNKELNNAEGTPYYKISDMNRKANLMYMTETELYVSQPQKVIPSESIIFPKNGGAIFTGKKRILKYDSIVDLNTEAICKKSSDINNRYLFNFISYLDLGKFDKGGALPSLNINKLKAFPIPIPPLSEQQRIVSYLDSAFAKIDAVAKNAGDALNEAKALFQSALTKMMEPKEGWEEKRLGDITCKITDGSHNPPKGVEHSGFMMLSSKNIRNGRFTFDNPRYLSKTDFEKENLRTDIEKGDILLTIVGAGLGQCCVYPKEFKVVFQRSAAVIKPRRSEIDNRFLMYSLQNEYDNIREKSNGAAQKGIYLSQLAKYVLSLPSLTTQQSIVATLDNLKSKVDQLQSNLTRTLTECSALKQAILRQTFE
ncbi:MAG: restriction endonuclease subunit S [Prevotella sp.]|nr:restriction endonuclease subunit S [Prevotella sp.]